MNRRATLLTTSDASLALGMTAVVAAAAAETIGQSLTKAAGATVQPSSTVRWLAGSRRP